MMERYQLYVSIPSVPATVAEMALKAAQAVIDRSGASAADCVHTYFTRDYITDQYINSGVSPKAPPEVFEGFLLEHFPDQDWDEIWRLAVAWDDAVAAAVEVLEAEMPGYSNDGDWPLDLREVH